MKKYCIQYMFICCLLFVVPAKAYSQSRLILNGAKINISKGASLVINNSASNAITRYNGFIISEGENNKIKWCIGNATGSYIVPLGYQSEYIPVSFTKAAGTGNGYFVFSSYHTAWNNSAFLPTGVSNVNYAGIDNSSFIIDRFWQIDASNYSIKPALANLTFSYIDQEYTATGNSIVESELGVQRWNPTISDWNDFIPGVTVNVLTNKATVTTVNAGDLYKWWILPAMNGSQALPVELVEFKGECDNGNVVLQWTTASEFNSHYFDVERSTDGDNWNVIATKFSNGNSSVVKKYSVTDITSQSEKNYYRLNQVDNDETSVYSSVIEVNCDVKKAENVLLVYPSLSSGEFTVRSVAGNTIKIIDAIGSVIYTEKCTENEWSINLPDLANGIYTVIAINSTEILTKKLLIQH